MTLKGFIIRLVLVALFTWVVGAIIESFWVALIWVLYPLWLYEVLRPRPARVPRGARASDDTPT